MLKKLDITKLRKSKKVDEESVSSNIGVGAGPIQTPRAFAKKGQKINAATAQAKKSGWKLSKQPALDEALIKLIQEELLSESAYNKFKNDVKHRTKSEQLHKAIREVKRKLQDIDRIVEYTQRMKQELSEGDGIQYWARTEKAVSAISEMVNRLNNKIKNLHQ